MRARIRFVSIVVALASMALAEAARADGPGCSITPCADMDGDGFPACSCSPAGSSCDCDDVDPTTYPGAPEVCDSPKDKSCNGVTGDPCGPKDGCLSSLCVPRCVPNDDFGCPPDSTFAPQPSGVCLCAPKDCSRFGCSPGFTCDDDEKCVANCHPGVTCPFGQRCRGFGCVDPCAGVVCQRGSVCVTGICVPACDCPGAKGCGTGESCDASITPARCVETACVGIRCAGGSHCSAGACVDDCQGVVCPPKRLCRAGMCTDLCSPDPCTVPHRCDWRTGGCIAPEVPDGGLLPGQTAPDKLTVVGGGWVCSTRAVGSASAAGFAFVVASASVLVARRRRRSVQ